MQQRWLEEAGEGELIEHDKVCYHPLYRRGSNPFPIRPPACLPGPRSRDGSHRANLSGTAQRYLDRLGFGVEDLFHHVLAVLHDPAYREANAGAIRMEWPRIPLQDWPDGKSDGAAEALARSAAGNAGKKTLARKN